MGNILTFLSPLSPYGYIRARLMLSPACQSAQMSKITNDGLTWSGTGRLYPYGNSRHQRVEMCSISEYDKCTTL